MNTYEDKRNNIHDTALVSPFAILGEGNTIGAFAVIEANVVIGDNNIISHQVTIGTAGEVRGMNDIKGKVFIGNNNVIREYCTIHSPQRHDFTQIGNDCFIMTKTHIGHDCIIGDSVTMSPMSVLGGSVLVGNYANLGMGAIVKQRLTIGEGCMLGMGSVVTKDIPPFETWYGNPAKGNGYNLRGLEKRYPNKSEEELIDICAV
jgi:UDP-N-acetylglucosamine acyltransferase